MRLCKQLVLSRFFEEDKKGRSLLYLFFGGAKPPGSIIFVPRSPELSGHKEKEEEGALIHFGHKPTEKLSLSLSLSPKSFAESTLSEREISCPIPPEQLNS